MAKFFSPTAVIMMSAAYAIVLNILLIATWHVSDLEGRAVDFLLIGLPWVLAFHGNNWLWYAMALLLNIATVYGIALTLIRTFAQK